MRNSKNFGRTIATVCAASALWALCAGVSGCGSDGDEPSDIDAAGAHDAQADAARDTGKEAAVDAAKDARIDVAAEAAVDAPLDVNVPEADAKLDASVEAAIDASVDAALDAGARADADAAASLDATVTVDATVPVDADAAVSVADADAALTVDTGVRVDAEAGSVADAFADNATEAAVDSGARDGAADASSDVATTETGSDAATCGNPSCEACMTAQCSTSQYDYTALCKTFTGTGRTNCFALIDCMHSTGCHSVTPLDCYCGTADTTQCLATTGVTANGVCKAQFEAAFGYTDPQLIQTNFSDITLPGGAASQMALCEQGGCSDDETHHYGCFPWGPKPLCR
jgi:hypothetical protein